MMIKNENLLACNLIDNIYLFVWKIVFSAVNLIFDMLSHCTTNFAEMSSECCRRRFRVGLLISLYFIAVIVNPNPFSTWL